MKLLLDEMHAPSVAALLRDRGHDAVAVKERADPRRFPRSAGNHASVLADSLALFLDERGPMLDEVESFVSWLERAGLAEQ